MHLERSELYLRVPAGIWVYPGFSEHPKGNEAIFRKQLKGNLGVSSASDWYLGKSDGI